jgi:hypothetical protein
MGHNLAEFGVWGAIPDNSRLDPKSAKRNNRYVERSSTKRRGPIHHYRRKRAGKRGVFEKHKQHKNRNFVTGACKSLTAYQITLGFFIHDFRAGRKSSVFGVWAAPRARDTMPKCGGLRPPYF